MSKVLALLIYIQLSGAYTPLGGREWLNLPLSSPDKTVAEWQLRKLSPTSLDGLWAGWSKEPGSFRVELYTSKVRCEAEIADVKTEKGCLSLDEAFR